MNTEFNNIVGIIILAAIVAAFIVGMWKVFLWALFFHPYYLWMLLTVFFAAVAALGDHNHPRPKF